MEDIVLWGVILFLLVGYVFLIRAFKNVQSKPNSPDKLIDSMRLRCEGLKSQIEQQNEDIASLLTENEQLKEALRGNVGYIIERNNKEILSLKKKLENCKNHMKNLNHFIVHKNLIALSIIGYGSNIRI